MTTKTAAAAAITRETLLDMLRAFAEQRPGLEFANYGDVSAYRSEQRSVTKDLHQARELLRAVELRSGIDAAAILTAMREAYSGRLSLATDSKGNPCLDYCTGQYFPTEFRRAVCAVCASALWHYNRENNPGLDGHALRKRAQQDFGPSIAKRWFR